MNLDLSVKVIPSKVAKTYTVRHHYMKTFPNPVVCFGVFKKRRLSGVLTFGYTTSTLKKIKKFVYDLKKEECLEMQRMHLLDTLGHNSESYVLSKVIKLIKKNTNVKILITHAGGCKNDCGIVYQASGWLYFGKKACNDFYLTDEGEYKNIVAPMRFGRVKKGLKSKQEIGEYLFGKGKPVKSYRYLYLYPIDKGIRRRLKKESLDFPKDSEHFRKGQKWVT